MKKILILLTLVFTILSYGQTQPQLIQMPLKLGTVSEGTINDSILVRGADKIVKFLPKSTILNSVTLNEDVVHKTGNETIEDVKSFKKSIKIDSDEPLDAKYLNGKVAYASLAEANTLIPIGIRSPYLTIVVQGVEYWWKDGVWAIYKPTPFLQNVLDAGNESTTNIILQTTNTIPIETYSENNIGIYGSSSNSTGVLGNSVESVGVQGYSLNNIGSVFNIGPSNTNNITEWMTANQKVASISYNGNVTGRAFIKSNGTAFQFLKADGSVDNNAYAVDNNVVHLNSVETINAKKTISADSEDISQGGVSATLTVENNDYSVDTGEGSGIAIYGIAKPGPGGVTYGQGVYGYSLNGAGLYGSSQTGYGIVAESESGTAIVGYSATNTAILGYSDIGNGIRAFADSGIGVDASSANNIAINAGTVGGVAGNFKVLAEGTLLRGENGLSEEVFKVDYLGNVSGNSFSKSGGVASQFLKANGSVDSTVYGVDANLIHKTGNETKTGTLNIQISASAANATNITTTGGTSHGNHITTTGNNAYGSYIYTTGQSGIGTSIITQGISANGVNVNTSGYSAAGVNVVTSGASSPGSYIVTNGASSVGIVIQQDNANSGDIISGSWQSAERFKVTKEGRVQASAYSITNLTNTPASSTATGVVGEIRYDANYIYLCVATNTWKRSLLTTW